MLNETSAAVSRQAGHLRGDVRAGAEGGHVSTGRRLPPVSPRGWGCCPCARKDKTAVPAVVVVRARDGSSEGRCARHAPKRRGTKAGA